MTTCTATAVIAATCLAVTLVLFVTTLRENRRQRAYRDALDRGDTAERDRMMGLE